MPRSKNPHAYADFYPRLIEAFITSGLPELRFEFPNARVALDVKNTYYRYRTALLTYAEKAREKKLLGDATTFQHRHDTAIQWQAVLDPPLPAKRRVSSSHYDHCLSRPTAVVFRNVSQTERTLNLNAQLDAQLPRFEDVRDATEAAPEFDSSKAMNFLKGFMGEDDSDE